MRLSHHAVLSSYFSLLGFSLTKNFSFAAALFTGAVFIDLDHLIDYYLLYKSENKSLRDFFRVCHTHALPRYVLILHSYDLLALSAAALYLSGAMNELTLGLFAGFFIHLALDRLFNNIGRFSYLFVYRLLHGFRPSLFQIEDIRI